MNTEEFGIWFEYRLTHTRNGVPEGTFLHTTADEISSMAEAYANDGWVFFRKRDTVNALAAFTYGCGWLDAGITIGFLLGEGLEIHLPLFSERIAVAAQSQLTEKTTRYCRMLEGALHSLSYAPDRDSAMHPAARRLCNRAVDHFESGMSFLSTHDLLNGLASFSYGYGWLDAGIRAGLLRIEGDRTLFTVIPD